MKLEEVVRILKLNLELNGRKMPKDTATALGIAIGAVERVKADRNLPYPVISEMLPGETN